MSLHPGPTGARARRVGPPRPRRSRTASQAATELLEAVAAIAACWTACRRPTKTRFLRAVAQAHAPNRVQRRRASAAARFARAERDEAVRGDTGIRELRKRPVVTTPNVFPPPAFEPEDQHGDTRRRARPIEPQHCYVCKEQFVTIHHFYDQLCPAVRRVQLRQAHRAGRPARPRGAADRRAREDRLPGRPEAAALRRAPDRHHALPARGGHALRGGARLRRLVAPAGDLRARPAAHAERRGVLPRDARHEVAPRLHRQQRLPDRAASAGVLRAHDGGGDGGARRHAGARPAPGRRLRGAARLPPAARGRAGTPADGAGRAHAWSAAWATWRG